MKIKAHFFIALPGLCFLMTACQPSNQNGDVVCQTYVHRYGVDLPPQEWSARGKDGQVVSTRKDGVVVSETYESGILHGETTYTFPHKNVIEKREYYDQGALYQETNYYPSGLPQKQTKYESGGDYKVTVWYESGAPQCREEYSAGSLKQGEYYLQTGQVESQVNDAHGACSRRDGSGYLQSRDEIQQGQLASRTVYHHDGTPASTTPYVSNVIQGERCTYSPTGEPLTIETWSNNCQEGPTTCFENGERTHTVPFRNGQKHGVEQRFRDNSVVVQEVTWVNGRKHGPCHSYIGKTKQTDWYFQDNQVNKATFDVMSRQ